MTNTITLLDIIEDTVVDGPGFRVSVYARVVLIIAGLATTAILELTKRPPCFFGYIVAKSTITLSPT